MPGLTYRFTAVSRESAMIVVLTQPFDPHVDHVVKMLEARGAEFVRFDPADFPAQASLSVGYAPNGQMRSFLRREESWSALADDFRTLLLNPDIKIQAGGRKLSARV
jgi:hypothetical protein